jgi:hypothetical protein
LEKRLSELAVSLRKSTVASPFILTEVLPQIQPISRIPENTVKGHLQSAIARLRTIERNTLGSHCDEARQFRRPDLAVCRWSQASH